MGTSSGLGHRGPHGSLADCGQTGVAVVQTAERIGKSGKSCTTFAEEYQLGILVATTSQADYAGSIPPPAL
jgi:hypothetical protein